MSNPAPIVKQSGVTAAERILSLSCAKSFLSLWSYPSVFRDQRANPGGDGKELCDLLVVFGNDLVIFSDKDCEFPSTGRLDVDWARWFRRAVQKSAEQLWGAERWIRQNPARLFLDRLCSQRLPVPLPPSSNMRVQRIVVAHKAASRCRELMGGSGSLVIFPAIEGKAHTDGPVSLPGCEEDIYDAWAKAFKGGVHYAKTVLPFAIGDVDPKRGFVHVFDDAGLGAVMAELDTAPDFIAYLQNREAYLRSGRLLMAAGEDDLLAHYLQTTDENGRRTFDVPDDPEAKIMIPEGEWELLQRDHAWIARKKANQISDFWDRLIEVFNRSILDGTSAAYPFADFKTQELAVRALAREPRFHRRILSLAFGDFLKTARTNAITARIAKLKKADAPYYVFLLVRSEPGEEYAQYRERRWAVALAYLVEAKRKFPDADEVVVLATEPAPGARWTSEDVIYRGNEPLTDDEIEMVREFVEEQGILAKLGTPFEATVKEYPVVQQQPSPCSRNARCPCGSGRKFKHCCMPS
jgi:hypothetical protein